MSEKVAIVTAASTPYFGLCRDLAESLRDDGAFRFAEFFVADCGLTAAEVGQLKREFHASIFAPPLGYGIPSGLKFLTAMTVRPSIPSYVQGYDKYIWIDADAYVAKKGVIKELSACLDIYDVVGTLELSRSYTPFHEVTKSGPLTLADAGALVKTVTESHLEINRHFLPPEEAKMLTAFGVVNSGVFAARGKCVFWERWEATMRDILASIGDAFWQNPHMDFLFEQMAFNVTLRSGGFEFGSLPETYNWATDLRRPLIDAARGCLVSPDYPYDEIRIMHLMGSAKKNKYTLEYLNKKQPTKEVQLTYSNVRGLIREGEGAGIETWDVVEAWNREIEVG